MYAKIVTDSISDSNHRLTTFELEYPYFIHAQLMTHRQFSRNAQSSRSVSTEKLIGLVENNVIALQFAENKKGMQPGMLLDEVKQDITRGLWRIASRTACGIARSMAKLNVHKQWVNRLLMPFMNIKVIVTATEFDNWFKLRLHHAAQVEIQELAQLMFDALLESKPTLLQHGVWHLPYLVDADFKGVIDIDELRLVSSARCARVSYLNHDTTTPNKEKDIGFAKNLWLDGHHSPFEHQATPMDDTIGGFSAGQTHMTVDGNMWSGNFCGFIQSRQLGFDLS